MNFHSIGLVLEGGGMRGVYTAGVLEYFLQQQVQFPYIVGVSAGACNAASYISAQQGRNHKVTIGYVTDPRYLSFGNWLRERSLFGMDFLFNQLPNRLVPFDFQTFNASPQQFVVGATDAVTGEAVYYVKADTLAKGIPFLEVIRASSSLPFVSPPVNIEGRVLFDGGVADPIPIQRSIADGNRRHVVVLTKDADHRKKPFRGGIAARAAYPRYAGLVRALKERPARYNATMDDVNRMASEGEAFVLRPSRSIPVGRMGRDVGALQALYDLGLKDAAEALPHLLDWLSGGEGA
ncbi:patatin family protein [Paenibacillus sp. GD4]|uniref:patatin-like phospholipase family protein n=1 Tax=Paenibacillus sp. GD4 TaxID=3068890 RepID=UPI00279663B2|nr:patatin family protein [Paenibacillus sp. GD4]MDQ1912170.1 patatin family protein [Paenibacillus sp. GD4]